MAMGVEFKLSGEMAEVVTTVLGYENATAADQSDANWLRCEVAITLPNVRAQFSISLTTQDVELLAADLEVALAGAAPSVSFEPDEQELRFTLEFQRRGAVHVRGSATRRGLPTVTLSFEFETDHFWLRKALGDLRTIVETYPVKE